MRNQFFYTMEYQVAPTAGPTLGKEPIIKRMMASFNIDKVIRSVETDEGKLIIILDDFHEEKKQAIKHNANGKPVPYIETQMLQSEITLTEEDKNRFRMLTAIPDPLKFDINNLEVVTEDGV